jgi:hypothetical protein
VRRFALVYVTPVVLLLLWRIAPLATGARTLCLRDVLHTHFEMKAAQAEAMRRGDLPLVDPYRAGGQPLLGNLNAVPLYPDNLLYLVAPPLWALNAHFWIHLLLCPFAMFWMARAFGVGREGAWAAGVCYALSGYLLSQCSFYNQIAGVALAPAFVAACLDFAAGRRRHLMSFAVAGLWALLLLGGADPMVLSLSLALSIGAVLVRPVAGSRDLLPLAALLACGTLLASPQIVEFLRIFGESYRGYAGYSRSAVTAHSWDPRQALEWILPLPFGRPDRVEAGAFWGERFFTNLPPFYFSLYPGVLPVALLGAAVAPGRPRGHATRWAVAAAGAGLFFALGRFNPLAAATLGLGGGILRFPVKFWLAVALGVSLLAGIGFERVLDPSDRNARKIFRRVLVVLALILTVFLLALLLARAPMEGLLRRIIPPSYPDTFVAGERRRWAGLCSGALLIALLLLALRPARRAGVPGRSDPSGTPARAAPDRPGHDGSAPAGASLLFVHAVAQIVFLAPLLASDGVRHYLSPPPLLDRVPATALVVHGAFGDLFGPPPPGSGPGLGPEGFLEERRVFRQLYPFTGPLWGRRYELNVSPEGIDTFLSTAARDAVRLARDPDRIRMLAAWGVEILLLDREIDPAAAAQVEPLGRVDEGGGSLFVYRVRDPAPQVQVVGRVRRAADPYAAVRILADPGFDPRSMVVLPGSGPPVDALGGEALVRSRSATGLDAEVRSPSGGVLVVQRAYLPLYRATIDGRRARIAVANLHRLAVELPPGDHRVRITIDRAPFLLSLLGVAAGLAGVVLLAGRRPARGIETL